MSEPEITRKIREELNRGITTESQVVYVLAEIRKFLEQKGLINDPQYEYLVFHCDWALHSKLDRRMAQKILTAIDRANVKIRAGMKLQELPENIKVEFQNIANLNFFETQLERFLKENRLPTLQDDWSRFVHLYYSVIQDSPLIMSTSKPTVQIRNATVSVESANIDFDTMTEGVIAEEVICYFVSWKLTDKNGETTELMTFNSYS
jgi:hypothetical protein